MWRVTKSSFLNPTRHAHVHDHVAMYKGPRPCYAMLPIHENANQTSPGSFEKVLDRGYLVLVVTIAR